jgi:hypothetical protein
MDSFLRARSADAAQSLQTPPMIAPAMCYSGKVMKTMKTTRVCRAGYNGLSNMLVDWKAAAGALAVDARDDRPAYGPYGPYLKRRLR